MLEEKPKWNRGLVLLPDGISPAERSDTDIMSKNMKAKPTHRLSHRLEIRRNFRALCAVIFLVFSSKRLDALVEKLSCWFETHGIAMTYPSDVGHHLLTP
jgi:hypothetical protein